MIDVFMCVKQQIVEHYCAVFNLSIGTRIYGADNTALRRAVDNSTALKY